MYIICTILKPIKQWENFGQNLEGLVYYHQLENISNHILGLSNQVLLHIILNYLCSWNSFIGVFSIIQDNTKSKGEENVHNLKKRNVWFWLLTEILVGWAPKLSPIISVNNFWWENIYHNCPDGDDDCPNYVDVALHHLLQLQQASLNIRWSAINLTLLYNSAKNLTELYNIKLTSLKWGDEKSLKHSWFECFINASSAFLSSSFTSPTSSPALYFLISAL